MRFVNYKYRDCGQISEIVINGENGTQIKCEKCGSSNTVKIFSPAGFKRDASSDSCSGSSSFSTCSGGSRSACSRQEKCGTLISLCHIRPGVPCFI